MEITIIYKILMADLS